jgi:hypothetical protein
MYPKRIFFHPDAIEIRQYEFLVSTIREKPLIHISQINEVNLNTYPPTIVINHNEVIFIESKYKTEFIQFVKNAGLKVEDRFDVWKAINETFADMEYTEHHHQKTMQGLVENGFTESEITDIRTEIKDLMQGWGAVSWERNYLGHYDLLLNKKQAYLLHYPRDFYWWSMEIALRNYEK